MQKVDVTKIVQPGIDIFGVTLMEPVTVITNLFISAMCFYAFWDLTRKKVIGNVMMFNKFYFLTMGIATTWGGFIGHGFLYAFGDEWKLGGWIVSMISVALIERSAISHANRLISPRLGKFFLIMNVVELVILMFFVITTVHFKFVEFHSAYGFIVVVFAFHLFVLIKTKDIGSKYIMYSTATLLLAVYTFNKPIILHTFFNHRDLAHIFMLIASWFMWKSALNLGKTAKPKPVAA